MESYRKKEALLKMKIYFAGSIRGGRDDRELYMQIINEIGTHAEVLTEHIGSESLSASGEANLTDADIYSRDMAWLAEADAVIAEVTQPSLGVGYELGWAEHKKPVLCLYRTVQGKRLSAMLAGNDALITKEYTTLQEAVGHVQDFIISLRI